MTKNAEKQRRYKAKMTEAGMVRVNVWIHSANKEQLREFAKTLSKPMQKALDDVEKMES